MEKQLKEENKRLERELREALKEKEKLQKKLEKETQKATVEFEKLDTKTSTKIEKSNDKIEKLTEEVSSLKEEKKELKSFEREAKVAKEQKEKLEAKLERTVEQLNTVKARVSELNNEKSAKVSERDNEKEIAKELRARERELKQESKQLASELKKVTKEKDALDLIVNKASVKATFGYNRKELKALYNQTQGFDGVLNEDGRLQGVYLKDLTGRNHFANLDMAAVVKDIMKSNPVVAELLVGKTLTFATPENFYSTYRLTRALEDGNKAEYLNAHIKEAELEKDKLYVQLTPEAVFFVLT